MTALAACGGIGLAVLLSLQLRGAQSEREVDAGAPGLVPSARPSAIQTFELDPELVWSSDLFLTDSRLLYRQERGRTEWDLAVSYASFGLDYRSNPAVDFFGYEQSLEEDRIGAQAGLRFQLIDDVVLLGMAGYYSGFPDYRRVWIANRYAQKYDHPDFPTIPGYRTPDPQGANVSAGARWRYLPASAFAELRLGYAYDRTAPGYADSVDAIGQFVLLRGREILHTWNGALSSENVLNARVRVLNELTLTDVSQRSPRFGYQGSCNVALAERWIARGYGGVTTEAPQFDAWFAGLTLEHEPRAGLRLSATGRFYRDTGEIENSLVTPSAAPPLRSWEAGAGARYERGRAAFKIYVGIVWADYAQAAGAGEEFAGLYVDRTWGVAQLAVSLQF